MSCMALGFYMAKHLRYCFRIKEKKFRIFLKKLCNRFLVLKQRQRFLIERKCLSFRNGSKKERKKKKEMVQKA